MFKKNFKQLMLSGLFITSNVSYACYGVSYGQFESSTGSVYWGPLVKSMNVSTPAGMELIATTTIAQLEQLNQAMMKAINTTDVSLVTQIQLMSMKLQDRIKKLGLSQIQSKIVVSNYKTDKELERNLLDEAEKFTNPITSCMQYAASGTFNRGLSQVKRSAAATSFDLASSAVVAGKTGGVNWEQQEYQINKDTFGDSKEYLNASALYSGKDGKLTRLEGESEGLSSLLNYLVNYSGAPKMISADQDKTYNGRRYSALQRKNAAFMALESYVISQSMLRSQPNPNLSVFYKAANLTMTKEQETTGVSLNELLHTYTQKMMSKPQLEFMATAPDTAILKTILQSNSVNTLMNLESLKSTLQQEALSAAELSLLTRKVLSPTMNVLTREVSYQR